MTDLLPCPFCGHEAVKETSSDGFTSIGCLYCNPLFGIMVQRETEAGAIAAWNTRAERTCRMKSVWGTNALQCSECFSHVSTWDSECNVGEINYCPNCGARVLEENDG